MFAYRLKPINPEEKQSGFLSKLGVTNMLLAVTEIMDESATC